jgi:hypothetical protein
MEQIKLEKGKAFAVIAYHYSDAFDLGNGVLEARYQYYRTDGLAFPFAVMDGTYQALGGTQPGGTMYPNYLSLYNQRMALSPPVDISLSLEAANQVRVQVTNVSSSQQSGKLHIALVERYRYYPWRDLSTVDFVLRNMLTGANGQSMNLNLSASASSVQQFSIGTDWNYCSIIAFFQTDNKQIQQGAMLALEDTIPAIQVLDPGTGAALQPGSTQTISWSINRSLPFVSIKYSTDAGQNWTTIQTALSGTNTYNWTVPEVASAQCLISVQDPYGEAQSTSGLFSIGRKTGDFNADSMVDSADRGLLIEHLIENNATQLSGADLNEDGAVDLFDLIYFDTNLVH